MSFWQEKYTVHCLRDHAPGWTWECLRRGLGWCYRGTRDGRTVNVGSYAGTSCDDGDDGPVVWMAYEDARPGEPASFWLERNGEPTP